jgi:uncharacterized SAM-binding protein YcdF (DUF218 family)
MFFLLSKTIGFLVLPSNLLIVVGLLGVLLLPSRFARTALGLVIASVLLIAICGFSPLGNVLMLPLENRFPAWDRPRVPDGMVVLGGSLDNEVSAARGAVALNESAERLTKAVELAKRFPSAKIVFSGGHGQIFYEGPTEAELAARFFADLGIPRSRVILEDRARDTAENARLSKLLAAPNPGELWLLVTSAHHMPRAVAAFRQVGFDIDPYPVDWRLRGSKDLVRPFAVLSDGLKRLDSATREWVGLLVYWLSGRSSELFPRPQSQGPRGALTRTSAASSSLTQPTL